jgi:mannose-6-phosphate isomerase-like protein (cupin superfamily)
MTYSALPAQPAVAIGFQLVAAEAEGLQRLLFAIGRLPTDAVGAVHHHLGDELIRVVKGKIRFTVDAEQRTCHAGDLVVIPPRIKHGFVVEEEAVVEVIGEQRMGSYYVVLEPDGRSRTVEVHRRDVPWDRDPANGIWTSHDEMADIARPVIDPLT